VGTEEPQRSNEFQRLIYLIHYQLHDQATVSESRMLGDRLGGPPQEVDILIEQRLGLYTHTIAVECRDRQRPADITWVQEMQGKHEDRTDAHVLVSRSGFTKNALAEAAKRGITTMLLDEALATNWTGALARLEEVFFFRYDFSIRKGFVVIKGIDGVTSDRIAAPQQTLYGDEGQRLGLLDAIATALVEQPETGRRLMEWFNAHPDRTRTKLEYSFAEPCYLRGHDGLPQLIVAIKLDIECHPRMTPLQLRRAVFGPLRVTWGANPAGPDDLFLVTTEEPGHGERTTLRIVNPDDGMEHIVHPRPPG
jgi:hypothetical protein